MCTSEFWGAYLELDKLERDPLLLPAAIDLLLYEWRVIVCCPTGRDLKNKEIHKNLKKFHKELSPNEKSVISQYSIEESI